MFPKRITRHYFASVKKFSKNAFEICAYDDPLDGDLNVEKMNIIAIMNIILISIIAHRFNSVN